MRADDRRDVAGRAGIQCAQPLRRAARRDAAAQRQRPRARHQRQQPADLEVGAPAAMPSAAAPWLSSARSTSRSVRMPQPAGSARKAELLPAARSVRIAAARLAAASRVSGGALIASATRWR